MIQHLSVALGVLNLLVLILVYRRIGTFSESKTEESVQKYEDTNIQNILNNRLLEIQNRRYSVRTNLEK